MKILSQSISIILASLLVAGQLPAEVSTDLQIHLLDSDGSAAVAGSASLKGFSVQVADEAGNGVPDAAVVFRLPDAAVSGVFADGTHAAVVYTDQNGRANVTGIRWSAMAGMVSVKVTATKGTAHAGILVEQTLTAVTAAPAPAAIQPAAGRELDHPSPPAERVVSEAVTEPAPRPVRQPGTLDASNHLPSPQSATATSAPGVTVTNGAPGEKLHSHSKTKWIILAAVIAAGAGAGIAMAGKSKSSTSSTSTGVSIGTPTVSVGAP